MVMVAVTLDHGNLRVLCINVYMPCDDGSRQYRGFLTDVLGFIESVADMYSGFKCIILEIGRAHV